MPRTRITAAIAAAVIATLAGCGSSLDHGTITGKQYEPAYTYMTHQCVAYARHGLCKDRIPVPAIAPARYVLDLKDGKQTRSVDVDEQTWDQAQIGQQYPDRGQ